MMLLATHPGFEVLVGDQNCQREGGYTVEESTLNETLYEGRFAPWRKEWMDIILCIFKEVIEGSLVLETLIQYKLIEKCTWILALGSEVGRGEEIAKILSTFVMTFPYEQQKGIFSCLDLKDDMDFH